MCIRALSLALAATTTLCAPAANALTDPVGVAHGYHAPRDAWGHPDLAGVWSPATITRLERDPKLGDRLVLSDAEAKGLEGENAAFNSKDLAKSDLSVKVDDLDCGVKGFPKGPECGYNNFWVDPGTKVMRIAGEPRSSIIVSPKSGRMPLRQETIARTQAQFGNARVGNFDGPERRPLGERCLIGFGSTSGPPMLPVLYNNHYAIWPGRDEVGIQVEMVHDVRHIRVGGAHEPGSIKPWMGDSVAHWEGETLVVETTNFRADQTFRGATADMKVTERFTRISPTQILYQFHVEDPKSFTAPVEGEVAWNLTNDRIYEYACHEGNYALPGILAGARNAEKQGKEMEGNRGEVKEEGAQ